MIVSVDVVGNTPLCKSTPLSIMNLRSTKEATLANDPTISRSEIDTTNCSLTAESLGGIVQHEHSRSSYPY